MRFVLALAVLLSGAGCGGGSASAPQPPAALPTAPSAALPAAPPGLIVGALVMKDRTAAISWGASTGATEYIVEVGSAPGGTDGGIHSAGAATSVTLRDLRAGRSHVRLKARNSSGTSAASPELTFVLPDLGDYLEALFLGSGPLIPDTPADPNLSCPRRGIWSGFPRGTTVRNLASAQIPPQYRDAIRGVLDQVPQATAGRLATTFEVAVRLHFFLEVRVKVNVFERHQTPGSRCYLLVNLRITRIIFSDELRHSFRYVFQASRFEPEVGVHHHPAALALNPFLGIFIESRH